MNPEHPMASQSIQAAGLAALLTLVGACATGRGGPQRTLDGGEGAQMVELDSGLELSRDLEIHILAQKRREGFLVCQFELHNKRGSQRAFEWTVEWSDQDNFVINSTENWRPLVIGGKGFERIQITAPTPEATSWRLVTRKPNPVR